MHSLRICNAGNTVYAIIIIVETLIAIIIIIKTAAAVCPLLIRAVDVGMWRGRVYEKSNGTSCVAEVDACHYVCGAPSAMLFFYFFVEPLNDLLKSRTKQQIKQIQAYSIRNFSFCSYACTAQNGVLENNRGFKVIFFNKNLARTRWVVDWLQCRWVVVNGIM